MAVREVNLEAVKVDENVAMWTIICRTTVSGLLNAQDKIATMFSFTARLKSNNCCAIFSPTSMKTHQAPFSKS